MIGAPAGLAMSIVVGSRPRPKIREHIPNAPLIESTGPDAVILGGETAQRSAHEIEERLTGRRGTASHNRMLRRCCSPTLAVPRNPAASLGDQAWRNGSTITTPHCAANSNDSKVANTQG